MSALATLVSWADQVRPWDDLNLKFWKRVLGFYAKKGTTDSEWAGKWARSVRASGVQVRLHGSQLVMHRQSAALEAFLCEAEPAGCALTPVSVSFSFQDHTITMDQMQWLHELLRRVQTNHIGQGGTGTLGTKALTVRSLRFHFATLDDCRLNRLARILEDPTTPPIDDLWLHTTSPKTEAECSSQTYFAAFRRVMAAALTAKGPIDTADVSLSLQWHSHVTIEIISALHDTLQSATRPLRRLSLAHINIDGADAAKQLGRLLFYPPRAVSNGSLINMSSLDFMMVSTAFHGGSSLGGRGRARARDCCEKPSRRSASRVPVLCSRRI